jgi:type VI protein secretion system component VasK
MANVSRIVAKEPLPPLPQLRKAYRELWAEARRAPTVRSEKKSLDQYLPADLLRFENHQTAIPAIAKDAKLVSQIEQCVQRIPTTHTIYRRDARAFKALGSMPLPWK